jgi:hypothetical protein
MPLLPPQVRTTSACFISRGSAKPVDDLHQATSLLPQLECRWGANSIIVTPQMGQDRLPVYS